MSGKKELAEHLKLYGATGTKNLVDLVQKAIWDDLREEFIRVLNEQYDESRQPSTEEALEAFDDAVRNMKRS